MSVDPVHEIRIVGGFREDGVWQVEATLRFPDGITHANGSLAGARKKLLLGILSETLRGMDRGATRAVVRVDPGDGVVTEVPPDQVVTRFTDP